MNDLKSERKSSRKMAKLPFEDAAIAVFKLGIKTSTQFEKLKSENKIPVEIPARPDMFYKSEWSSWKEFIEKGNKLASDGNVPSLRFSYQLLKATMRRLAITSKDAYLKAIMDGRLPEYTPTDPEATFPDEFEGWSEFVAVEHKFVSYAEAKRFVKPLRLKNSLDWRNYCREGLRPSFIPSLPDREYEEFTTWEDFLGVGIEKAELN